MTVIVTLPSGGTHRYMRYGDVYVKLTDGTLTVTRSGARELYCYGSGEWTDVAGDEKRQKRRRLWG